MLEKLQAQELSKYDQAKMYAASVIAGAAIFVPGGAAEAHQAEEGPVVSPDNPQLEQNCINEALYSFRAGRVGYGRPDQQGQFFRVKQTVRAKPISEKCDDIVDREIGVQQIMGGRTNTDYSVVSRSEERVNKTINQRGYRAWKCFKRFSQRVFITASTDNRAERKVYNGYKSKPNC